MKKVLVISGTRSEYGLLRPLLKRLKASKNLKTQLVITGSHLEKKFGQTIKEVNKDFKISATLSLKLEKDTNEAMSLLLGQAVLGFTKIFKKLQPSIILILGDRVEIFGAALAAYYLNIPIAHLHGGDKSIGGHLDDSVRHAITKLAHLHLAASEQSAERIIKMGEENWRVRLVGAPGLDSIREFKESQRLNKNDFLSKMKIDSSKSLALLIQHPITTETKRANEQVRGALAAIQELALPTVVIYPNADAGGRQMIKAIEKYRKYPFIKIYKNIEHDDFLRLLAVADVMLGNSSSGIIESPSFKLPFVNIGKRQEGRERANNVIDVGYDKEAIKSAIKKALSAGFKNKLKKCRNPYGDGLASQRIVKILERLQIDDELLQKKITY